MVNWALSIIVQYRRHIFLLVLLQLACGILIATQPRFYQQLVSLAISGDHLTLWSQGIFVLTALAIIYCAIALLQGVSGYVGSIFSTNLLQKLQTDFFEKTSQLPLEHFQKESAGEFFTTFTNDIGHAQRFFAALLPDLAREIITTVAVSGILFYFCPVPLTLAALSIVIAVAALTTFLNRIMGSYAQKQRREWGEVHRAFDETLQGIGTLKVLAAEEVRCSDLKEHTGSLRRTAVRAGTLLSIFSPGIELFTKLGSLGLVALAYFLIARGSLGQEAFLIFFFYSTLLQMSVAGIARSLGTFQNEYTGLNRIAAFLDKPVEADDDDLPGKIPSHPVSIEFKQVGFRYPQGRTLYSRAILTIPAKAVTMIQGKSGSGKSTLINLLLRFYSPEEGDITIDGTDIRQIPRAEIRKKIGVVTQHHFIFGESLKANLLISNPDATDREILLALNQAQLSDYVSRLPVGIDTVLDPAGRGMSAGEKQRLCIARLLLRQSPLMILDEPWANLDLHAREKLSAVINSCKEKATILILSHDSPQNLAVDFTYQIDEGKGVFVKVRD